MKEKLKILWELFSVMFKVGLCTFGGGIAMLPILELELVEVEREVLEEVRLVGVVAVAQHGLALEVRAVVPQLVLDIGELRIELVLLGVLRPPE